MKVSEVSFRDIYHQFLFIREPKFITGKDMEQFIFTKDTDAFLTYCYIDEEAGMTFELICTANFDKEILFPVENKDFRWMVRSCNFLNSEMKKPTKPSIPLSNFTADTAIIDETYDHGEFDEVRRITFIDHLRSKEYPDDILVVFLKDGFSPEQIWVKTKSIVLEDGRELMGIKGLLLNEPYSDFGVHMNDELLVRFVAVEPDEKMVAVCKFD